jgi:hypothetical protein
MVPRGLFLGCLAALTVTPVASAEQPTSPHAMRDDLDSYYGQEVLTSSIIASLGAAGAGTGGYLVTRTDDFSRGLGWTLLPLGTLELVGGILYVVGVRSEIRRYGDLLATDAVAFRDVESKHIEGTRRRFLYYRLTELGLAVAGVGIGTYGFVAKRATFEGIGVGGFAVGLPFLVIDSFNNAHAARYAGEVERFVPTVGVGCAQARESLCIGLGGSF